MTTRSGPSFAATVAAAVDDALVTASRLGGGDVAESYRIELASGRTVFAKTHRDPPPHVFTTEAASLAWLAEAGAVRVPAVLHASDGGADRPPMLVLEWVEVGRGRPGTETTLGRELADLHRSGADAFGRLDRRTTGSRRLPNEPCATWVEFFAGRRLEPLRRLATEAGALPDRALRAIDVVVGRLGELGGPPEPPARLHGDLWAGNRLVDVDGRSWLIDPAAHGGHREFDLAMMLLFGGFGNDAIAAYDDAHPLADGWERRVPLHQLAPLIVHAIKFGGGYVGATERALEQVLGARRS